MPKIKTVLTYTNFAFISNVQLFFIFFTGRKIILLSSLVFVMWFGIGVFVYKKSFHSADDNVKLSNLKSPEGEEEVFNCKMRSQKLRPGFWKRYNFLKMQVPESVKESLPVIKVEDVFTEVQVRNYSVDYYIMCISTVYK